MYIRENEKTQSSTLIFPSLYIYIYIYIYQYKGIYPSTKPIESGCNSAIRLLNKNPMIELVLRS